MAVYDYTAKNLDGRKIRGRVLGETEEDAYRQVRLSGLYVVKIKPHRWKGGNKTLNPSRLAVFCNQLSSMLGSGIPLVKAVSIIRKRESRPELVLIYENIYLLLLKGHFLSDALERQEVFPVIMLNMVRSGEAGGNMGATMAKLAAYYRKEERLKRQLVSAMIYPAFLLILTMVSLLVIFTVVLPNFFDLFQTLESLPFSTKCLMWLSTQLRMYLPSFCLGFAFWVMSVILVVRLAPVKKGLDRLILKLPFVGHLLRIVLTARFARTLNSLYSGGLSLVQALSMAAGVTGNSYVETQFPKALEAVCNGFPLSGALAGVEGLDEQLVTGIFIGEESGELDTMLEGIADSLDSEAEEAAKRLTALAEPVLIVLLAVIIGFVMMSVMLPIYEYYKSIG